MKILFQEIINKAIEMKASDVHFIPVKNEVSIKFRINDNLEQYEQIGNSIYQKLLVYMKFQAGLDVSTQQVAQSGRYSYHFNKIYFWEYQLYHCHLAKKVVLSELYLNFSTTEINL